LPSGRSRVPFGLYQQTKKLAKREHLRLMLSGGYVGRVFAIKTFPGWRGSKGLALN